MNYPIIGEVLTSYEQKAKMRVKLEDLIKHTHVLTEQLREQTLFENETILSAGDPAETALALAGEAILIFEKLHK